MLITASGYIKPGFLLLTLGHTCRYGIVGTIPAQDASSSRDTAAAPSSHWQQTLVLFDPGSSAHLELLNERLSQYQLSLSQVSCVFLTHLHVDRMAAVPYLRALSPSLRVIGSGAMQRSLQDSSVIEQLYKQDCAWRNSASSIISTPELSLPQYASAMKVDLCVSESEVLDLYDGICVRVVPAPGHTSMSLAYIIDPYHFLIIDEVSGYYRGRQLCSPGADDSLEQARETLEKFSRLELSGLCFTHRGVLVGQLVRKHLHDVIQNSDDLTREFDKARAHAIDLDHIKASIRDSFYTTDSPDPFLKAALNQTCEAIWRQLTKQAGSKQTGNDLTN